MMPSQSYKMLVVLRQLEKSMTSSPKISRANGLQFVERRISMDSSKFRNTFFYVRNPNLGSKRSKSRGIMDRIGPERVFWLSCTSFCNFFNILGGKCQFFSLLSLKIELEMINSYKTMLFDSSYRRQGIIKEFGPRIEHNCEAALTFMM